MKQFISGALAAVLAIAAIACTTATTSSGSGNSPLMKVNGRPVTAEELIKSTHLRQSFREFVMYDAMRAEATKTGVKVDEAELTKRIEETKKNLEMQSGQSWAEYLKTNGVTEKEYIDRVREQMLFEALIDSKLNITDDEIKKVWETDKEALVNAYINSNHLPESDKAKVTFEQVKELARDRVKMNKSMMMQGEIVTGIVSGTSLELPGLKDPADRKAYEDLILNYYKEQAAKEQAEMEKQRKEMEAGGQGGAGAPPVGAPPTGAPPAGDPGAPSPTVDGAGAAGGQ